MSPTLVPGDRIIVNKLLFGARIYTSYNFSKGADLQSFRTWGIRKIQPGDILVFNHPTGYHDGHIAFKINYVYCKRCIGIPGDTLQIINSYYRNNRYETPLGYQPAQQMLSIMPDSLIDPKVYHIFPDTDYPWNIKNTGPIYVPKAGDTLQIDSLNHRLYRKVIEFESGLSLTFHDNKIYLGDSILTSYCFRENYYFCVGDNVLNSNDSRYWGFIPEPYIIGIATRISYSRNPYSGSYRTHRFLQKIH